MDAVDLRYRQWGIEVKTTSADQAWPLAPGSKASPRGFDVGQKRGWDAATGVTSPTASRAAHCYVLCVYRGPELLPDSNLFRRIAVLNPKLWRFHVMVTEELDGLGDQRRIGLRGVQDRWPAVAYRDLAATVDRILEQIGER